VPVGPAHKVQMRSKNNGLRTMCKHACMVLNSAAPNDVRLGGRLAGLIPGILPANASQVAKGSPKDRIDQRRRSHQRHYRAQEGS